MSYRDPEIRNSYRLADGFNSGVMWRYDQLENTPIPVIPEDERVMPDTLFLAEMFWHPHTCEGAECDDENARRLKDYRAFTLHLAAIPAWKSVPELPHLPQDLLQFVETGD